MVKPAIFGAVLGPHQVTWSSGSLAVRMMCTWVKPRVQRTAGIGWRGHWDICESVQFKNDK